MVRRAVCRDTGLAGQPWLAIPLGVAKTIDASPATTVSNTALTLSPTPLENRPTRSLYWLEPGTPTLRRRHPAGCLPGLDAKAQVDATVSGFCGGELECATLLDPSKQRCSSSQDERVHNESKLVD